MTDFGNYSGIRVNPIINRLYSQTLKNQVQEEVKDN